jgi:asparagine synthase (glutamine-hydrolysing)
MIFHFEKNLYRSYFLSEAHHDVSGHIFMIGHLIQLSGILIYMCGIAGKFLHPANINNASTALTLQSINLRGPDANDIYADKFIRLGSTRLEILDPTGGVQPFIERNRYVLIFNGQIYNHLRLREKIRGEFWRTHSDTETLIKLLIRFGVDILSELEGMFALAFWDKSEHRLLLARDRSGEKPLFYFESKGSLVFGSNTDVVRDNLTSSLDVNYSSVSVMLNSGFVPPNSSVYKDVHVLEPDSYIIADLNGITKDSFRNQTSVLPSMHSAKTLSDLLIESVNDQTVADVDIGLFLSGGIDSSLLAFMASANSSISRAFCADLGTNREDVIASEKIARQLGIPLTTVQLENSSIVKLLDSHALAFDEPFGDSASLPLLALSAEAKKHVGVCLSGDGADELFAGYPWRYRPLVAPKYQIGLNSNRLSNKLLNKILKQFHLNRISQNLVDKGVYNSISKSSNPMKRFFEINYILRELGENDFSIEDFNTPSSTATLLEAILQFEQRFYLTGDILVKTDRASMFHSLEVRTPFLNSKIIEFARNLKQDKKINWQQDKIIIQEVYNLNLKTNYAKRKKSGLGGRVSKWLEIAEVSERYESLLSTEFAKSLNSKFSPQLLNDACSKSPQFKWNLFCLLLWAECRGING